jgi:diketogulonate reductase-like aldo/keto reductase
MLMLCDSPDPKVIQAQWKVMEEALSMGLTRSVGVINFCQLALEAVLQTTKVTPSLNYYM